MNITVPEAAIDHFWEEPPKACREFWAFRFKPKCMVGDTIIFKRQGKPIARAICDEIEPPGKSECARTGKFRNRWKIYWRPETFEDLR